MTSPKSKKLKVAVFDIDGTIFRSSLLIEYIYEMVRRDIFPQKAIREVQDEYQLWLDRKESYDVYIMAVVRMHLKYLKGTSVKEVQKAVQQTIRTLKYRNYRYTTSLIQRLKKQGFTLITISGSPQHVVEPFAKELGFDYWFGTLYEEKEGKYTGGVVLDNSISRKDTVLKLWAEEEGFEIDYTKSYAIGDTHGDASLMRKVGKPIAFNPNSDLVRVAQKNKWPVIVERKDVIYDLKNYSIKNIS